MEILAFILQIMIILITIDVVVSIAIACGMRVSPYRPPVSVLRSITEPLYQPIRRLLPSARQTGGLDFAPMLVVIILQVLRGLLH